MNNLSDQIRNKKEAEAAQEAAKAEAGAGGMGSESLANQALEAVEGQVEGKVSELVKESAGEEIKVSGGGQDDGAARQTVNDEMKDDRAALKAKLLKNAPPEKVMRSEIETVLIRKKEKLESKVKKYRRKRNYHLLSLAVMQLRLVVRQLEEVAKAGYEALKDIWLKVVHRLA